MARYRKVDSRIWNDAKFRSLTDNGKLAFLMLLTHPGMTALGGMRSTIPGLAEELGWTTEAFREAFREALRKGMAEHDEKACLIVLPNFLRYNRPESPNVVKAWVESLDLLPECALKGQLIKRVKGFTEGMSEAFGKALPEAFAKAMPYQEPEQDSTPIVPEGDVDAEVIRTRNYFAESPLRDEIRVCPIPERIDRRSKFPQKWLDEIYLAYPRHERPDVAKRAIAKALTRMVHGDGCEARVAAQAHEDLLSATKLYADSPLIRRRIQAGERSFIPHPATWFNQGGYNSDPAEWQ
jgi:hypothetical protein